jgi:GR25 family glycosyltransferase involved in LPS biosynthesis
MPPWRPVVAVVVTAGLLLNIVFYPWKDVSRVDGDMGLRLRLTELWRNATAFPHTALLPYADTLGVTGTVFVANLPRRVGRLQSMTALADTIGAHFTLVDAFDKDAAAAQNIIDHVRARRAAPPAPFAWPAARPDVPLNWTGPLPPGTPVADGPLTTNRDEATPIPPNEAWQYQWLTTGSVACWETHLRIVRQIADMPGSGYWSTGRALPIAPADVAIILEDDVDMELDIRERLLGLWSALPKEWDMVFLGMSCLVFQPTIYLLTSLHHRLVLVCRR